jgi:hypothetical protein
MNIKEYYFSNDKSTAIISKDDDSEWIEHIKDIIRHFLKFEDACPSIGHGIVTIKLLKRGVPSGLWLNSFSKREEIEGVLRDMLPFSNIKLDHFEFCLTIENRGTYLECNYSEYLP